MLADDEGGLLVMKGEENPRGGEIPVGHPQLSLLHLLQHRPHQCALLRVGVLGGHHVHHQVPFRRIHHQRLPGQRTPRKPRKGFNLFSLAARWFPSSTRTR